MIRKTTIPIAEKILSIKPFLDYRAAFLSLQKGRISWRRESLKIVRVYLWFIKSKIYLPKIYRELSHAASILLSFYPSYYKNIPPNLDNSAVYWLKKQLEVIESNNPPEFIAKYDLSKMYYLVKNINIVDGREPVLTIHKAHGMEKVFYYINGQIVEESEYLGGNTIQTFYANLHRSIKSFRSKQRCESLKKQIEDYNGRKQAKRIN